MPNGGGERSPAQQAMFDSHEASNQLKKTAKLVDDLWLQHILSPTLIPDTANLYAHGLSEILAKIDGLLATVDDAHREELEAAFEKALATLKEGLVGDRCIECGKPAVWVRETQFSGDHFYCAEHAEQQEDFGKSDPSYFVWKELVAP